MRYFWKSILAGVCIGLGGTIFLRVGGVVGACLFAFGLIAVVSMGLNLFTGKAQFVWRNPRDYAWLLTMLGLNIAGCLALALAINNPAMMDAATGIINARLDYGPLRAGVLAIGCGFIMTLAVQNASKGHWLPLLFGIPAFILCGLPHCIADAFYICCLPHEFLFGNIADIAIFYLAIVAGNFLGCNAYRLTSRGLSRTTTGQPVTPSTQNK